MKNQQDKGKDSYLAFLENLADSVYELSDEEYLAELKEDDIDLEKDVASLREMVSRTLVEADKKRRQKLFQQYEIDIQPFRRVDDDFPDTPGDRRLLLEAMLGSAQSSVATTMTVQYRNLSELSDEDVKSMIRNLRRLKALAASQETNG